MDAHTLTRKDWARLVRVIAHDEDVVERFPGKLFHSLGSLTGDVDAQFAHNRDGFGSDPLRFDFRAEYVKAVPGIMAQQPFGHLASRGIAGAEYQHPFLFGHSL